MENKFSKIISYYITTFILRDFQYRTIRQFLSREVLPKFAAPKIRSCAKLTYECNRSEPRVDKHV